MPSSKTANAEFSLRFTAKAWIPTTLIWVDPKIGINSDYTLEITSVYTGYALVALL